MKQILSLALFLFLFSCSSDELAGLDSEIDVEKTSVLDRNLSGCSETRLPLWPEGAVQRHPDQEGYR